MNIRPETIELLEENMGKKLLDIHLGDDFLEITPKAQTIISKINRGDYRKLEKAFVQQKKPSTK